MATLTAQILAGTGHPNDGGINPTHSLFLSENSRPAWVLTPLSVGQKSVNRAGMFIWIPTVEHMLEDALLMVAVLVVKNAEVLELVREFGADPHADRMEMYSVFDESQRNQLYAKCRELKDLPKLIVSVFRLSTIESQLSVLDRYKMDVEVCVPVYTRFYSHGAEEAIIEGSLDK